GEGMLIFAHGIFVDREGNVWVTDGQDNAPAPARGTGAGRGADQAGSGAAGTGSAAAGGQAARGGGRGQGRSSPPEGSTIGHQVYKFSPDGKLLLTLGKPGGAGAPDYFY